MTDVKKDLIEIETNITMPVLDVHFDVVKSELEGELSKYENVLVTEETLKDDKKLAQTLVSKGKLYDSKRKATVNEISAPIKLFETQMKLLQGLCVSASKAISDQVAVFEQVKLNNFGELLAESIEKLRLEMAVEEQYHNIGAEKVFIKLGSITGKGAMNKASKDGIQNIVDKELMLQNQVAFRLLQLESESYKAELESPLVRENVESFLFLSDADYALGLDRIIKSELARQVRAKEAREAKQKRIDAANAKKIADQKELDDQAAERLKQQEGSTVEQRLSEKFGDDQSQENSQHQEPVELDLSDKQMMQPDHTDMTDDRFSSYEQQDNSGQIYQQDVNYQQPEYVQDHPNNQQQSKPTQQQSNKAKFVATVTFEILAPSHVPEEAIAKKIFNRMQQGGFDSITGVVVNKA